MSEASEAEMLSILFVDDDRSVLDGLRRALRTERDAWRMEFCESGEAALAAMSNQSFDVVVSDMRMPGMDGAEFLAEVRRLSPSSARIVLSGYAEFASLVRSSQVAHQFLDKPCDTEVIKASVERIARCRAAVAPSAIRDLLGALEVLPTPGKTYEELATAMQGDYDIATLGAIVSGDIALTAEILRLVNTPFFGLVRSLVSVDEAVGFLGSDVLTAIVASRSVFVDVADGPVDVAGVNKHSRSTANLAAKFAECSGAAKSARAEAFAAGLLHDVGVLALAGATHLHGPRFLQTLDFDDVLTERLEFGVDRFSIGQHLLMLWGFSDVVVDAVIEMAHPLELAPRDGVGWIVRVAHEALTSGAVSNEEAMASTVSELAATLEQVEAELLDNRTPSGAVRSNA
ncbi:MAG: HDOD domain-containing protein [Ilumatobacter sp.]